MAYELAAAPPVLYRVGSWPHPFNWWPPRAPLDNDHPRDGYRWDDPRKNYEFCTLYLATEPIGCFLETLPHYKQYPEFEARVAEDNERTAREKGEAADPDGGYVGPLSTGEVDADYFLRRVLGRVRVADGATFIDVDHPRTHATLTSELVAGRLGADLSALLQEHGIEEFDRSVVMHQDRRITRLLAAFLHATAPKNIAGIRYESRVYRATECWAMWDRARDAVSDPEGDGLTPEMPDLQEAAALLDLKLPSETPHPDH